ncbi:MAG: hypothetical protein HC847_29915 [Hydrococcus sp. RU_2_2]|nr:hypothetical protein [Hydrococcus sp. RU_2_2]
MSENGDYKSSGADKRDRYLEIYVEANQPELLQGLDEWLRLGLISPEQIKKIARNHLSCALPIAEVVESISSAEINPLSQQSELPQLLDNAFILHPLQRVFQEFFR